MLWRWRIDRQSAYLAGQERSIEAARYAAATLTSAHPGLHGSAEMENPNCSVQMENPTKAITAKLTTIIAIAATSMIESRLRSNAMMRYLGGGRATALI